MTQRLFCIVPFCRRTTKPDGFREWICGPHWRPVSKRLKRLHAASKRRHRRAPDQATHARCDRVWALCKRHAIEAAGGLA